MYRFFETIRISDGQISQINLHQERLDKTRHDHFPNASIINLVNEIKIPSEFENGIVRCRVDYGRDLEKISFSHYKISTHSRLKIIEAPELDYEYKYADRDFFSESLRENPDCDDIIFTKNGFVTDATYSNIILQQNKRWFTPETFLLRGTKRGRLLKEKKIVKKSIHIDDLVNFEKIAFINAMRDFEKIYTFTIDNNFLILNPADL